MCGLVGAAGNLFANDIKAVSQLLFVDQLRGAHSTGIFTHSEKEGCYYYKKALPAADFLQQDVTKEMISIKNSVIAGHNRYATMGEKTEKNAHPFHHGEIVLMHNGTLTTRAGLSANRKEVDSEHIAITVDEKEEVKEVLEALEGAFALVWFNTAESSLNFARNSERELFFAFAKDKFFWCSEKKALEWILDRNNITDVNIEALPVGKHVKFSVTSRSYSKEEFDFSPKKAYTSWTGYYGGGGKYTGKTATLFELGYYSGMSVDFVATSFTKYNSSSPYSSAYGALYGRDVDTDINVVVYGVKQDDVQFLSDGSLDKDVVYSSVARGVTTPAGKKSDWVSLDTSQLAYYDVQESAAILSIVDDEKEDDYVLKKSLVSYTDYGDEETFEVAGTLVNREEMEVICQVGCDFCGHPFSEAELKSAVYVNGFLLHGDACHKAYKEAAA